MVRRKTPAIISKRYFILLGLLIINTCVLAQKFSKSYDEDEQAGNALYVEFGGSNITGLSMDYERYFSNNPRGLSAHAGLGILYWSDNTFVGTVKANRLSIPLGLTYNIPIGQNKKHFLEAGAGFTFFIGDPKGGNPDISGDGRVNTFYPTIGWRYLSGPSGLLLRLSIFPILIEMSGETTGPWLGFSIGKKF